MCIAEKLGFLKHITHICKQQAERKSDSGTNLCNVSSARTEERECRELEERTGTLRIAGALASDLKISGHGSMGERETPSASVGTPAVPGKTPSASTGASAVPDKVQETPSASTGASAVPDKVQPGGAKAGTTEQSLVLYFGMGAGRFTLLH